MLSFKPLKLVFFAKFNSHWIGTISRQSFKEFQAAPVPRGNNASESGCGSFYDRDLVTSLDVG